MTESIVDRIKAALDDDERVALDAAAEVGDGQWQQRNARIVTCVDRDREVADYAITECIDHIVRHDPARVLRQVAAMRKILDFTAVMDEDRYPGADYVASLLAEALGIEEEA